jgi:endonuclease/exonuclease/phosphatase family metal-dependent hydrolase
MNTGRLSESRKHIAYLAVLLLMGLPNALAFTDQAVRVATWNLETVGQRTSAEYGAAFDVLARIDADIVAICEVASNADVDNLANLAFDLGYAHSAVAPYGPFGALRTAFLSDFPITFVEDWSSPELSGDASANDLTRYIFEVHVDVYGSSAPLRLIVTHMKAGSSNTDEYRRAIEAYRIGQAASDPRAGDAPLVIMGDLNADINDEQITPEVFTSIPTDLPSGFVTGRDIQALLSGGGLFNDPFVFLTQHASILNAQQLDGTDVTRPESGRRIDYLLASPAAAGQGTASQVYDCADEGLPGSLPLAGSPLNAATCLAASDHLPVFADLNVSSNPIPTGDCLLNWAEHTFPELFPQPGTNTQFESPYRYRYYSGTNAYLGISDADNHVYYLGSDGKLKDVGLLSAWVPQAGCSPKPTQCLFGWAEKNYSGLFSPAGAPSLVDFTTTYRYYWQTNSYLGLSSETNHVVYAVGNGQWVDAGPYDYWMGQAGCSQ